MEHLPFSDEQERRVYSGKENWKVIPNYNLEKYYKNKQNEYNE